MYILNNFGRDLVHILSELKSLFDREPLAVRRVEVKRSDGVHIVYLFISDHLLEDTQLLHKLLLGVFQGSEVALRFLLNELLRVAYQQLLKVWLDELIIHITHGLLRFEVDVCFELGHVGRRVALLAPFLQLSKVVEP